METKENQNSFLPPAISAQRRSFTERHGTTIKVVVVGILILLLLIPLSMIESMIRERRSTKQSAINDVTSKWGGEQTVTGPCLVIPYAETIIEDKKEIQVTRNLLVLPEALNANGNVSVEKRKRGIYDASVYNSDVELSGEFDMAVLKKMNIPQSSFKWNEMQVILGLSDLKGITEKVTLQTNGKIISFESGLPVENLVSGSATVVSDKASVAYDYNGNTYELFTVGLNAKLDSIGADTLAQGKLPFNIKLKMNGSQGLYVVPIGKTTTFQLQSNWATPSFDGEFLPANRDITKNGFTSDWKVLDLNRSYGQVIRADNSSAMNQMASSRFGVRFIQSVDQYQQNLRSVKYAILIILLTFVVVFFIEMLQKKSVNPFQYLLVGLALVLFYSLLLSMSEVWGFNLAYIVAALMTTVLIMLHLSSILKNRKQGLLIGGLLAFLYVFIFILIQMESFALLVGSLGLFAILAVIMYYSKKIKF
ncbi:MAG: cell envelope integrity protein CreD [Bacteroidia bacterium]|nr:cell envelope integrity protein CreD [Bacteroidia bacterium]